jgi:hypothetical protein
MLNRELLMKRLALAFALALAVFGGVAAVSAVSSTYVAACTNPQC